MPDKTLGGVIARERKRRGWSQVDLADVLQCGEYTLARWETGKAIPCPRLLIEIEKAFGWRRGTTLAIIAGEE
jgi:transcriptional regulator with XRE-family HTH domain